jgi:hypothetical protein
VVEGLGELDAARYEILRAREIAEVDVVAAEHAEDVREILLAAPLRAEELRRPL